MCYTLRNPAAFLALLLAVGSGVLAGCSRSPAAGASAVLITIDTWRSDRFGAGGHPDVRTPNIDRFFRGGAQFRDAIAPIPTTLPSHVSILTGLWPPEHGVPRNVWQVPDDVPTLPELLRDGGFATAAFVSSAALDATTRIDRGFDVYDDRFPKDQADDSWRPAPDTIERARTWWRETAGRRFLWVHLFEPHLPYRPRPEDVRLYPTAYPGDGTASVDWVRSMWFDKAAFTDDVREYLESLYHAEITGADRALGAFLRELADDPGIVVVLTSDHGESLGEHGLFFKHGPKVYAADVAVPLLLRGPEIPRSLSAATVRTIDIPATFLAMLAVPGRLPPDPDDLRNWIGAAHGGLPAFSVASAPNDAPPGVVPRQGYVNALMPRALRRDGVTFLEMPLLDRRARFDRREDPGEEHPERPELDEVTTALRSELEAWIRDARVTESRLAEDPEFRARMRSLGYLD